MGRRLREERDMNNLLNETRRDPEIFTEVDILKKEIGELQKTLQNSFIKIKELRTLVDHYDKNCPNGGQLELNF
jgi:hypothetical protein